MHSFAHRLLSKIKTAIADPRILISYLFWTFRIRKVILSPNAFLAHFSSFSQFLFFGRNASLHESYIEIIQNRLEGVTHQTIVDIGANIGSHACAYAKIFPAAQIFAFEPLSSNLDCLRKNIATNRITNIHIEPYAVTDKSGPIRFRINHSHPQNAKIDVGDSYACEDVVEMPAVSLDDFAAENCLSEINLLKIDTEGAEANVLRGSRRLLAEGRIDVIHLELGPSQLCEFGDSVETLVDLLSLSPGTYHIINSNGSISDPISTETVNALNGGDILYLRDQSSIVNFPVRSKRL